MKGKTIIALVLSTITVIAIAIFCLVAAFAYYAYTTEKDSNAIVAVLNQQQEYAREMQAVTASNAGRPNGIMNLKNALAQMISKLRSIDTSNCPMDFRESFMRYCDALGELQTELASLPQTDAALLLNAAGKYFADKSAGIGEMKTEVFSYVQKVQAAETEVKAAALHHGVTFK